MMTSREKLDAVLMHLCGGNKSEFSRRMGLSQQAGQAWFNRGTWNEKKILAAFPELSSKWVFDGIGAMFDYQEEDNTQMALDILGITQEQVDALKNNDEHAHIYVRTGTDVFCLHEGESVDRALLNMLLAEKAQLMQEIAVLRQRNLELEKQYAVEHERLTNAEKWYHQRFPNGDTKQ